jgi:hypothetical protein
MILHLSPLSCASSRASRLESPLYRPQPRRTLIIWDKLFGAFEPENPADPLRFGLTKNIATDNPVPIAFHEWVDLFRDAWRVPGWTNKLRYVFGNPGWRHEPGPGPTFGARQPT